MTCVNCKDSLLVMRVLYKINWMGSYSCIKVYCWEMCFITESVCAPLSRSAGLTDVVVYGVQVPGCEGRVGMAAIVQDIGNVGLSISVYSVKYKQSCIITH